MGKGREFCLLVGLTLYVLPCFVSVVFSCLDCCIVIVNFVVGFVVVLRNSFGVCVCVCVCVCVLSALLQSCDR